MEDDEDDAPRRRGFYGSSSYASTSRTYDEAEERERVASARTKRPSHSEYAARLLTPAAIQAVIIGAHQCRNRWDCGGQSVQCQHQLWAVETSDAVQVLARQRQAFLALNSKGRAQAVYDALSFEAAVGDLHGSSTWQQPLRKVIYRTGPAADRSRSVCREMFLEHFPTSLASLKRRIQEKRVLGLSPSEQRNAARDKKPDLRSVKSLNVIAWWTAYAEQTSEKLPDVDQQLTPHRYLADIHDVRDNRPTLTLQTLCFSFIFQHLQLWLTSQLLSSHA
eukprot:6198166-Pleurochrysis_carterae.AAC.1